MPKKIVLREVSPKEKRRPIATRGSLAAEKAELRGRVRAKKDTTAYRCSLAQLSHLDRGLVSTGHVYDWSLSTRDNYQAAAGSDEFGKYAPPFAATRATLDASYHGVYTLARQEVQDELICATLANGASQDYPWIVFTAGAMGAGKSRTMDFLSTNEIFPLSQVTTIDPDIFKTALPEWDEYVKRDALSAGSHTRKESGMLCEIAQTEALAANQHIWVDGSLRDGGWYRQVFEGIAKQHPQYSIAIFHIVASDAEIFERARKRGEATGRFVPEAEIWDSITRVPAAVEQLASLCRFVATIDNSTDEPRLVRYRDMRLGKDVSASEGGDGLSFGEVRRRFHFKGFVGRYLYKVVSATRASSVLAARLSAARNSSRHSTGRHSAGRASAGRASTARDAQSRVSATRDAQSRVSAPDERKEPGKLSSATSMTSPLGLAEIREDGEPADAERSTPASGQVDRA